jgi:uncharacterized protein (TIGR03435 family)
MLNQAVTLLSIMIILAESQATPQVASGSLTFEVASVKRAAPAPVGRGAYMRLDGGPGTTSPGQITYSNVSLMAVLQRAFAVKGFQIQGPKWLDSESVDILARFSTKTTPEEFRTMLQNLLVERFKLKFHREDRDLPIYELSISKNGPKLRQGTEGMAALKPPEGFPELPAGTDSRMATMLINGRFRVTARHKTVSDIVTLLMNLLDRPVKDKTGLSAAYDFVFEYAPPHLTIAATGEPAERDEQGPTIFEALTNQLGLKLEPKRGAVDMLFIDQIDQNPVQN